MPKQRNLLEASTIMHELGHNLGLTYGGRKGKQKNEDNHKPNYLSIMNYSYQLIGLQRGCEKLIDYSRFDNSHLRSLNEEVLVENDGVTKTKPPGSVAELKKYGIVYYCPEDKSKGNGPQGSGDSDLGIKGYTIKMAKVKEPVDWNCNTKMTSQAEKVDINADAKWGTLEPMMDWNELIFSGGAIGQLGAALHLPLKTDRSSISEPTLAQYKEMLDGRYSNPDVKMQDEKKIVDGQSSSSTWHWLDAIEWLKQNLMWTILLLLCVGLLLVVWLVGARRNTKR